MKPRVSLAESITPTGVMKLVEHDGAYAISLGGQEVMHSRANASECLLGSLGVARMKRSEVGRVLIGGLGLGFTLKSALESVGNETIIEVAEMIPEVIEWNRTHLKHLNGSLLDDSRVRVREADVLHLLREAEPKTYDAILLDVDNGPMPMVSEGNAALYSRKGIRSICRALKSDGRIVFWSAGPDQKFENRLDKAGLEVESVRAKAHEGAKSPSYLLYVAEFARPSE